jgi:type IV pilus assembly protein PilM
MEASMSTSSFYKYFPIPKIMDMNGVGIDISENTVRFVSFSSCQCGLQLKEYGSYPVPEDTFLEGKIINANALREILVRLKNEHGILFAHTALPETQTYLAEIEVPDEKNGDARENIELQFEEHVPLKINESLFDYQKENIADTKNEMATMVVTAAPKEAITAYTELFSSSGITLLSLEMDAQAIARIAVSEKSSETVMLLNVCHEKTGMYVVSDRIVTFVSSLETGGKDFLTTLEKELKLTPEDAKKNLRSGNDDDIPREDIAAALAPVFSSISEEVNKHFIYWHERKDVMNQSKGKISRIILCGPEATVPGLSGYLAADLHVSTEMANIWGNIFSFEKYIPPMNFCESLEYATAIGLAAYLKET